MAFDHDRTPNAILDELSTHPHGAKLVELVHALAASAYDERRTALDAGLDEACSRIGLDRSAAETTFGNVLTALGKRERATSAERTLLGALVAKGAVKSASGDAEALRRAATSLAWLSAHTAADALSALEPALVSSGAAPGAAGIFEALSALLVAYDAAEDGAIDRPSAVLVALAIGRGATEPASRARAELASKLTDPALTALALGEPEREAGGRAVVVSGEETSAPRGSIATFLLTVTLILPLVSLAKLFGRFALRLRRPVELSFAKEGVRLRSRLEILGKTIREREIFLASANLVRAAREVRYPKLATYLGIVSLLAGSYLGLKLAFQGVRSGSPELLGVGVVILVVALGVDYGLSILPSRTPDRCRIVLEPRRGGRVAVAYVDRAKAEAALALLRP